MPAKYVDYLIKKGKGSKEELENKWEDAKKEADKQYDKSKLGEDKYYGVITKIFKNMIGEDIIKLKRDGKLISEMTNVGGKWEIKDDSVFDKILEEAVIIKPKNEYNKELIEHLYKALKECKQINNVCFDKYNNTNISRDENITIFDVVEINSNENRIYIQGKDKGIIINIDEIERISVFVRDDKIFNKNYKYYDFNLIMKCDDNNSNIMINIGIIV